jgi:hypothetical protein
MSTAALIGSWAEMVSAAWLSVGNGLAQHGQGLVVDLLRRQKRVEDGHVRRHAP